HRATDDDGVAVLQELVDDAELVAYLDAAEHADERPLRIVEQLREHLDLARDEPSRRRRQYSRRTHYRGVRPVRRAKRVVDVDRGELRQVRRERGTVLGLAL